MKPILSADGLTVVRQGKAIVDGVDLSLSSGERLALIGPNGAGKTTLLRCLAGSIRPERGAVVLHGRDLLAWHAQELAQHRAVLRQQGIPGLPFTVREVVEMGRAPHGSRGLRAAVDAAIACLGLEPHADRPVQRLSGGEQQRVHLARALAQLHGVECPLLFLDEPTNNLDPRYQAGVLSVAGELADRGGTVVAVLHDLVLASLFADRVVLMSGGSTVCSGHPDAVLSQGTLEAVYNSPFAVLPHPETGCPVALPAAAALSPSSGDLR